MIDKIKNFFKDYYKAIIIYIVILLLFLINLPYYISTPGGLIDTKDKIKTTDNFKMSGSLNMAYVSEIHASIPTLIYSFFNKDWDVEKEEEVKADNESVSDKDYRNKMLLKESNLTALLVAYKHSNIDYKITNNKVYITYIDKLSKTNLKIGDQILKVDNTKIDNKKTLYNYISSKKINDKIIFKVKDKKGNIVKRYSKLIDVNSKPKVGAIITETYKINSNKKIKFNFNSSESGSSGGLMLTLTIYSHLNKIDLTNNQKIVGTGTIDESGNVGSISGIKYKLIGAVKNKADVFLVPYGSNYKKAIKIKNKRNYDIEIVPVKTFDDALKYLEND